jgi:diacylglycerol kinase
LSIKESIRSRIKAIKIALEGITYVLKTQLNARIHAAFTLAVFLLAGLLKLPRLEWMILLLTVGLVWAAEIFNTAVEVAVDIVSPDYDPKAKIIKDISAGAVLVSVFISILIGLILFGLPLWSWIKSII